MTEMESEAMEYRERGKNDGWTGTVGRLISRRVVIRASGLAALALLSGSALGAEEAKKADAGKSGDEARKRVQQQAEQSKAFFERFRNANSEEERTKIMSENYAQRQRQAIEDLKGQLGISDADWPAVKPRIETVYNLVHPQPQMFGPGMSQPKTEVQLKSNELRELLRDEKAATERIKSTLAAYRAAKEKANRELVSARQNVRQVMTLRQEALLVLNGLLD
jgi:hypothetical protein